MRLVVARCEVTYTGRLNAYLPEAIRLLVFKADGSVLVHADSGGYKPLNWMTPPTVIEQGDGTIVVRKRAGRSEDRLEIRIAEVLAEFEHELGEDAGLEKDGVERHLQEALAERPDALEDGLRLVRREWPTEVGPVDLMCRDAERRLGRGRDQARRDDRGGRAALALPRGDPPRPGARRLPRDPRRPVREAAGADALRGARARLRRGRPRACCAASASPS